MPSSDLLELRFVDLAVLDTISVQEASCLFRDHGRYKPQNDIAVPASCERLLVPDELIRIARFSGDRLEFHQNLVSETIGEEHVVFAHALTL